MLKKTMTLKEMIDARPTEEDWQQGDPAHHGILRLCLVASKKEEAYQFLRGMAAAPFHQLCQSFFTDFLASVCYDFEGQDAAKPTFILLTEYQFTPDYAAVQALLESIITALGDSIEVIADIFPHPQTEKGSMLRVYTQNNKVTSGWIQ